MNKLPILLIAFLTAASALTSCGDDDDDLEGIKQWRRANDAWLAEMQAKKNPDGTPYYTVVVPKCDPGSFVLMHFFNERTKDPLALKPLYTSTVDVRYRLSLYNGVACDSSSLLTEDGPGIFRTELNGLIDGWAASVCEMNVGDTAEVIVPYGLGYGTTSSGSIPAFSNLKFNIRLADIYLYEKSPEKDPPTSGNTDYY